MDHLNWADYLRLFNFVACVSCLLILLLRFKKFHHQYNEKTRDYWFALTTWTVAGLVGSLASVLLNAPTNPGTVLTTAAVLASIKGALSRSAWGGPS